jgi:TM2 domain-containing membrane protein YozV
MKNYGKIILVLFIKLIIGALIFLLMQRIYAPEKQMFNEGIYNGFIGLAIFFTGEAIWKVYQQQKQTKK